MVVDLGGTTLVFFVFSTIVSLTVSWFQWFLQYILDVGLCSKQRRHIRYNDRTDRIHTPSWQETMSWHGRFWIWIHPVNVSLIVHFLAYLPTFACTHVKYMIHGRYYQSLEFSWVVWSGWSGIPQITPREKSFYCKSTRNPNHSNQELSNFKLGDYSGNDNVDGRNPAPVDMVNISLFTRFYTSQVVQDFFHQQYLHNPVATPLIVLQGLGGTSSWRWWAGIKGSANV